MMILIAFIEKLNNIKKFIKEKWFNFRLFWVIAAHMVRRDCGILLLLLLLMLFCWISPKGLINEQISLMLTGVFASGLTSTSLIEWSKQYQLEKKYLENTTRILNDFYYEFLSNLLIDYKHYLELKNIEVQIQKTPSIDYLKNLQNELDEQTFQTKLKFRLNTNETCRQNGIDDKYTLLYTGNADRDFQGKFKLKDSSLLIYTFIQSNLKELSSTNYTLTSIINEYTNNKACINIHQSVYKEFNSELNNKIQETLTSIYKDPFLKFLYTHNK